MIYHACPKQFRNAILALLSFIFYSLGEQAFLPWFVLSITINFFIGIAIDRSRIAARRRAYLAVGVASDLGLLVVFKYAGFLISAISPTWKVPELALPLGISFFTFHKISYKVDVYRRDCAAKSSPVDLALYLLFFPQLIAGPIVRFKEMAHDLVARVESAALFQAGIRRFAIGLSKKMLIANPLGQVVGRIFYDHGTQPGALPPETAWLGILCYTGQIYFDFSGYSDMAIGMARMFGFVFPENFDHPYISRSVTEFWQRWHMSLSRWFRDYVYIPLGGNRLSPARTYLNLCIVFLLCGLWHGAAGRFLAWGAMHGMLLALERAGVGGALVRLPRPIGHGYTLLAVMVTWVFFRADSFASGVLYLQSMFLLHGPPDRGTFGWGSYWSNPLGLLIGAAILFSIPVHGWLVSRPGMVYRSWASQGAYAALLSAGFVMSLALVAGNSYNPFIYFRF